MDFLTPLIFRKMTGLAWRVFPWGLEVQISTFVFDVFEGEGPEMGRGGKKRTVLRRVGPKMGLAGKRCTGEGLAVVGAETGFSENTRDGFAGPPRA